MTSTETTANTASGRLRSRGYEHTSNVTDGQLNRFGRAVDAVKTAIRIEDVAAEYTALKLAGPNRLLGRCPHPDHTDRTPSFTVYSDSQRFRCFGIGCGVFGDVVDLEKICGNHGELWEAMVALSVRYGIELPARSEKWRKWQDQKLAIEDLVETIKFQTRCRRMFKVMVLSSPEIQDIEDPTERREEIRLCWEAFQDGMRRAGR